jgi:hypothetical protein
LLAVLARPVGGLGLALLAIVAAAMAAFSTTVIRKSPQR